MAQTLYITVKRIGGVLKKEKKGQTLLILSITGGDGVGQGCRAGKEIGRNASSVVSYGGGE